MTSFDYRLIIRSKSDGHVIAPISYEEAMAEFEEYRGRRGCTIILSHDGYGDTTLMVDGVIVQSTNATERLIAAASSMSSTVREGFKQIGNRPQPIIWKRRYA